MSAYTSQNAKSKNTDHIRLERAFQELLNGTNKTPYDRVKRCWERIRINAAEWIKDGASTSVAGVIEIMQVDDEIAPVSTLDCVVIDCVWELIMMTHRAAASAHFNTTFVNNSFRHKCDDGEFVDMTLAADGHLVKVHKNIVALASPYLKAMIQSTPCQHPVVFLNNITQEMLCFILEYMYTGEVKIPPDSTPAFIEACKALHINGVEHLFLPKKPEPEPQPAGNNVTVERLEEPPPPPPENNFAAHITINSDLTDFNVEVIPNENITINQQKQLLDTDLMNYQVLTDANVVDDQNNCEQEPFPPQPGLINCELRSPHSDKEENQNKTLNGDQNCQKITLDWQLPPSACSIDKPIPPSIGDRDKAVLYSLSVRGSLQLLLNRFMYYCHHHSCYGRKRRWRCIDYRRLHCPAFIDTENDNIIKRSEDHIHTNHDTKILRKFKSKKVFATLSQAEELVVEKRRERKRSLAADSRGDIS